MHAKNIGRERNKHIGFSVEIHEIAKQILRYIESHRLIYIYIYVYIHVYVCIHIFVYIHMYETYTY